MNPSATPKDIQLSQDRHVTVVEICKPPHNYFDLSLLTELADQFEALDADPQCRAIVLAAQGRSFCAGADFSNRSNTPNGASSDPGVLYAQAVRLFRTRKPIVAAVQGPAVGGGLGLALVADFRITCPEARFTANFNRLGFHPGFGLSATLPRLVGPQKAALLLYTGCRITGEEAVEMGLADELVPLAQLRQRAIALASDLAISAPLAVMATRASLRLGLAEQVEAAVQREAASQRTQFQTEDFREGIVAMSERREPVFTGR